LNRFEETLMKMRLIVGAAGMAAVMFLMPSCSSDDGDDGGLVEGAGSSGAAGGTGAAGASSAGGASSAAGASGAAGAAGAGGTESSGGTGGSMGAAAPADPVDSGGAAGSGGAGDSMGALSFDDDVLPLLQEDCGDCHAYFIAFASDDAQASYEVALEQSSYEGVDQPRYDVIVARVEDGTMPPECGGGAPGSSADCVTEENFGILRDWANSGEPPSR
jgi:hypothetical protein